MIISCPKKKEVWKAGQAMLGTQILDPYVIWQALTFQSIPRSTKAMLEWIPTLLRYGRILQVIWSCHWNVVFEEISWSHANAMQRLQHVKRPATRSAMRDGRRSLKMNSE
ncbi:hypothetical protein [Absidia glauca]|uniref:Uncharacterized protein n=1 Tax=Absidia glauca TaxID=4829 RepID=A0A163IU42_ABSGL|nr:hypothetical protein [Absidia glauca]